MRRFPYVIIVVCATVIVGLWLRHGYVLAGGESGYPFYNSTRLFDLTKYAWSENVVGMPTGMEVGSALTHYLFLVLSRMHFSPLLIQAVFLWFIVSGSGLGVYALTGLLCPSLPRRYRLLAVFFYWFNPMTEVNVWSRFLYNFKVFYAFLPVAVYIFILGLKTKKFIYAFVFALASVVFSYSLTSLPFVAILWALLFFILLYYLIFPQTGSDRLRRLFFFSLTLFLFILANFWWISQNFTFLISSSYSQSITSFFSTNDNLSTLSALSDRLGKLIYLVRLMHADFYNVPYAPWGSAFVTVPFVVLEFIISAVIFLGIIIGRKSRELLLCSLLFILGIFLSKGTSLPFGSIYEFVFEHLGFLQVFRNPFEKFGFIMPLFAAPLYVFSLYRLEKVFAFLSRRSLYPLALILTCVFLGYPVWTDAVHTSSEAAGPQQVRTYESDVPSYYRDFDNWLKQHDPGSRLIVLPITNEAVNYTWPHGYAGVELSNALLSVPSISFNTTIPYYSDFADQLIHYQLNDDFFKFIPFTGAKYLVLRSDIDFKARKVANPEVIRRQLKHYVDLGLLTPSYSSGQLTAYKINPQFSWPKLYITPSIVVSNTNDLTQIPTYLSGFPTSQIAVNKQVSSQTAETNQLLFPLKVYAPQITTSALSSLKDDDILARLFFVKHLPGEKFYFWIRLKELLLTPKNSDEEGQMLYRTGILGKRAVEIYDLKKQNHNSGLINQAENDYASFFSALKTPLQQTLTKQGTVPEVIRDSLIYQSVLLSRVQSRQADLPKQLLADMGLKPLLDLPATQSGVYLVYPFYIPRAGDYQLVTPPRMSSTNIYVDSQVHPSSSVTFSQPGIHEISLLDTQSQVTSDVLKIDSLSLADSTRTWDLSLPDLSTKYQIDFDFKFSRGNAFNLYFYQDIDAPDSPVFSAQVRKDPNFHDWQHWGYDFTPTDGASTLQMRIFPVKQLKCQPNWWGQSVCGLKVDPYYVDIRNFRITKITPYPLALKSSQFSISTRLPSRLVWREIDPTRYTFTLDKPSTGSEELVFSELYDTGWKLKLNNQSQSDQNHRVVNSYANGWVIDQPGTYSGELIFAPQLLFSYGKYISVAVVCICIGAVFYFWRRPRIWPKNF